MKTNNAFDPLNLSEVRSFVVIPAYLRNHYDQLTTAVYAMFADTIRDAILAYTREFTGDERAPDLLYVFTAERQAGPLGFWMPAKQDTFNVFVPSNGYENKEMDAATYGAAVTLLAVNHLAWALAEDAEPGSARSMTADLMCDVYLKLRDWFFDLSEQELLDGVAIAGFID